MPRWRSQRACSRVSTPSAMTATSIALAIETIARRMWRSPSSSATPVMNSRSTLIASIGKRLTWFREE